MFNENPYWMAAKYAFMIATGATAGIAVIRGAQKVVEKSSSIIPMVGSMIPGRTTEQPTVQPDVGTDQPTA